MRLSAVLAALLPAGGAFATTFQVVVGNNSELTFSPSSISNAVSGDNIQFIFATKNHTATQSTFADPCTAFVAPGQPPIDSGFMPVPQGTTTGFPTYNVQLMSVTAPLWFYCKQTNPVSHCEAGMVFAVNPTAEKSFAAFQAAAQGSTNATSLTTSSGIASAPASTAASSTDSSAPSATSAASTTSAASAASDSSAPSSSDPSSTSTDASTSGAPSSTDSSSNTTSPTSSAAADTPTGSSPAGALRVGSTGVLLGGIGLLALAL